MTLLLNKILLPVFFLFVEASDGGNDEQLHSQRDDGQLKEEGKQWIHLRTHFLK